MDDEESRIITFKAKRLQSPRFFVEIEISRGPEVNHSRLEFAHDLIELLEAGMR
jgi:hypothetical protein